MAQERIVETRGDDGEIVSRHVVIEEGERRSGSGWLLLLVLLIAVVAAIFLFGRYSDAEVAKDNAIGQAANEVGEAANKVGDAAQDAVEQVR